ncbi:MAG: hypothetical protein HYY18_19315 [Planctomycetes bacterium]|nr:hypothetical protein [Planctomycetota bacterium]
MTLLRRGLPPLIYLPANEPLQRRRWVLWPDRLVQESQVIFSGWSPDLSIRFDDVLAVYRFRKARPLMLLGWLVTVPMTILWMVIYSKEESGVFLAFALVFALASAAVGWEGFRRRPHLLVQTSVYRREIRMDRPWYRPELRRYFFDTLGRGLGIGSLYT